MAASNLHSIQFVREQGYPTLGLGSCRSFLDDGGLANKVRWGLSVRGYSRFGHFLHVFRIDAGVKSMLRAHPFIHIRDGELWGAVFGGNDLVERGNVQRLARRYFAPGLRGMAAYVIGETPESLTSPATLLPSAKT